MKQVRIVGENGSNSVDRTVTVDDAKELAVEIMSAASGDLGAASFMINDTSGAVVVPIGVGGIEDAFEGICSVSIVPVNKAG